MLSPLGQGAVGTILRAIAIVGYTRVYDESGTAAIEKIAKLRAIVEMQTIAIKCFGRGLKIEQL